ncbi:MAG: hypothetical protein U0136_04115 [Bdellovibrionota bacterium]
MRTFLVSTVVFCALGVTAAHADDQKYHSEVDLKKSDNGGYEQKVSTDSTDAQGTRVQHEDSEKGKTTVLGGTKVTTKSETTTDPKGLMNKHTDKAEVTAKSDKDGNVTKKYSADSVDASNTAHSTRSETETKVKDGRKEVSTETKRVDDPEGLGNKQVTKVKTTEKQNADGSTTTSVKREKNGDVVEDTTHVH